MNLYERDQSLMRPCLWCSYPLEAGFYRESCVECPCGLLYSVELLLLTEDSVWIKALNREGYEVLRKGDSLEVHEQSRGR